MSSVSAERMAFLMELIWYKDARSPAAKRSIVFCDNSSLHPSNGHSIFECPSFSFDATRELISKLLIKSVGAFDHFCSKVPTCIPFRDLWKMLKPAQCIIFINFHFSNFVQDLSANNQDYMDLRSTKQQHGFRDYADSFIGINRYFLHCWFCREMAVFFLLHCLLLRFWSIWRIGKMNCLEIGKKCYRTQRCVERSENLHDSLRILIVFDTLETAIALAPLGEDNSNAPTHSILRSGIPKLANWLD